MVGRTGGIAQLGEHLLCKQGVSGSSPLTSTIQVELAITQTGSQNLHGSFREEASRLFDN